jgi:hypothetical protein
MKIYQSMSYQVQSQRVKQLWLSHINEDDDIPQQLVKITQLWEKIIQFGNEEGQYTNQQLKRAIGILLPPSWDSFTGPYIRGNVGDRINDLIRRITSQEFIGLINEEYELCQSC